MGTGRAVAITECLRVALLRVALDELQLTGPDRFDTMMLKWWEEACLALQTVPAVWQLGLFLKSSAILGMP